MAHTLRRSAGWMIAGGLLVVASCASPESGQESVASSGHAIVAGTVDTVHTAVVAVAGDSTVCSGTIVQVSASTGYALTAAHCCVNDPPKTILVGNDYNTGQSFTVVPGSMFYDSSFDPLAGTGVGDLCMIKFSGADGTTPVLPVVSAADGAAVGVSTTIVGYGNTAYPSGFNSKRRATTSSIQQVAASTLQMSPSPTDGGACDGDSGGPVLLSASGSTYVLGVISQLALGCAGSFTATRVSSEIGAGKFVTAYLSDAPIGKHVLDDGGIGEIDSDAGTSNDDAGASNDGGSSTGKDGGTSSGGDGGSGTSGDGGSSVAASNAGSDDGGGCSTSHGRHEGGPAVPTALGLLAISRRRRRRAPRSA